MSAIVKHISVHPSFRYHSRMATEIKTARAPQSNRGSKDYFSTSFYKTSYVQKFPE